MAVALDTTITYPILSGSYEDSSVKVKSLQLGDGYRQTELDGINNEVAVWQMVFADLSSDKSLTLKALLNNSVNGNANILSWTPPDEGVDKYWTASAVRRKPGTGVLWTISCTLTQGFPI